MRTGTENRCFPVALGISGTYSLFSLEKMKGPEIFKDKIEGEASRFLLGDNKTEEVMRKRKAGRERKKEESEKKMGNWEREMQKDRMVRERGIMRGR